MRENGDRDNSASAPTLPPRGRRRRSNDKQNENNDSYKIVIPESSDVEETRYESGIQEGSESYTIHKYDVIRNESGHYSKQLENLSVGEVSEVLKQLKLDRYVDTFRENDVDGELMSSFSKELLKEHFNFKRSESIRLLKYVETGHIPR